MSADERYGLGTGEKGLRQRPEIAECPARSQFLFGGAEITFVIVSPKLIPLTVSTAESLVKHH